MPQLIVSVEGVEIRHITLRKDRTTLGRRTDNDIILDNLVVSGHHCVFELKGVADVSVEDLHSTNGTYINGRMVKRQQLKDGDVLAIGSFRIQYLSSGAQASEFGSTTTVWKPLPEPARSASFQVVNGSSAGLEMPVVKAVTTFGKPGVAIVSVSHRRGGYYVSFIEGESQPTLNGGPLGIEAVQLEDHDVLELAGTRMLFRTSA